MMRFFHYFFCSVKQLLISPFLFPFLQYICQKFCEHFVHHFLIYGKILFSVRLKLRNILLSCYILPVSLMFVIAFLFFIGKQTFGRVGFTYERYVFMFEHDLRQVV